MYLEQKCPHVRLAAFIAGFWILGSLSACGESGGGTVAVVGVSLDRSSLSLTAGGGPTTLVATLSPSDATDRSVTWSSSNTSVATVSATGVVAPVAPGSATITVTTVDGGLTASCAVTVAPATGAVTGHLYVPANDGSNDGFVLQYAIGPDGQLAPLTPASVAAEDGASAITFGPDHAYVLNNIANTISQYSIGAGGGLSPLAPASVGVGAGALYLTLSPAGDTMFVPVTLADEVTRYSISSGALTVLAPTGTGDYPESACAAGTYLYVGNYEGNSISQYSIGAGGALTPLTPATVAATGPLHCVTSPDDAHVYFTSVNGHVLQFAVGGDGTLAPLSPASVMTGLTPIPLLIDPTGTYVYAVDSLSNQLALFTRAAGGTLTAMSPATITTGGFPQYGAFDPSGDFFYLPLSGDHDIAQYSVSAAGLTALSPATVDTGNLSPSAAAFRALP